jgi:hypothetical protein
VSRKSVSSPSRRTRRLRAKSPADGKYFSGEPKPGERYWLSHSEENVQRSAEETKILKELFGR